MELVIKPDGSGVCIYGEELHLESLGELEVRRVSHVEPDVSGRWWADLAPVNGPRLGPFGKRSEALGAEVSWLKAHLLEV